MFIPKTPNDGVVMFRRDIKGIPQLRHYQVYAMLAQLPEITGLDVLRTLGISSGGLTKAVSELRNRHGIRIVTKMKVDPITGARYASYRLSNNANAGVN